MRRHGLWPKEGWIFLYSYPCHKDLSHFSNGHGVGPAPLEWLTNGLNSYRSKASHLWPMATYVLFLLACA